MLSKIWVDPAALGRSDGAPILVTRDGVQSRARAVHINGPTRVVFDASRACVRVWIETESEIAMDDEIPVTDAPTPAPARPLDQTIAETIDRWFGDHSIPNHFQAAKDDLKRRLSELPKEG